MKTLDIRTLSERTGLRVRQIKFVLEHELVPSSLWKVDEHLVGRARVFEEINAVYIACAAFLMNVVPRRESVREMMTALGVPRHKSKWNRLHFQEFERAVIFGGSARAQLGDRRYVRWIIQNEEGVWHDSGWPNCPEVEVTPNIIVELNVGRIREMVAESPKSS